MLGDKSPRVRFFAAIALGKLGRADAAGPLLTMLRASADKDPYLRHAGVMGLTGSGKSAAWKTAERDRSAAVRMAILLAMRRLEDPEIARFLNDVDPRLVLEAARAINDVPIGPALSSLARLRLTSTANLPLNRRVLNANFRLGGPEHAAAVAEAAARSDLPEAARVMALEMLGEWASPSGRDRVVGLWRPIAPRSGKPAADALRPRLTALVATAPEAVMTAAVAAIAKTGVKEAGAPLAALAADGKKPDKTRAEALKTLDLLADPRCGETARRALLLPGDRSRTEAMRLLAKADPTAAIAHLRDRLAHGATGEQQGALAVLGAMPGQAPCRELSRWLDRLLVGQVPPEIELDLIEAASRRVEPECRQKLEKYQSSKPKGDSMAAYREVLSGGDALRGMSVFANKAEVECLRCHKLKSASGESIGGEVGPELSSVGARQNRPYLLESIVSPDKQIAQGFESIVVATSDGKVQTGVFRGEDDKEVRLITAEGKLIAIPKGAIEDRKRGPTAMPSDLAKKLSKTELRDLIEFLASLKTPGKP